MPQGIRGPQVMLFGEERALATKLAPTRYDKVIKHSAAWDFVEDPADLRRLSAKALDTPAVLVWT